MLDVAALGELLIDFTPLTGRGGAAYERNAGGAPANVLAALQNLGGRGAFIGKVGDDAFGAYLKSVLDRAGVDTRGLSFCREVPTTLAFVHLDEKGDRSFSFYRHPGADLMLRREDVDRALIEQAAVFHFGSLSMTDEPSRSATLEAVGFAKKSGRLISFDPNDRPSLWRSREDARKAMLFGLESADIVKLSDGELAFLTGETDLRSGARAVGEAGARFVAVTLGAKGCFYLCGAGEGLVPTYDTAVVDTTGAGDAFTGALLYRISRLGKGLGELSDPEARDIVSFANAAGALCAAGRGAIPAMPDLDKVLRCRREIPLLGA